MAEDQTSRRLAAILAADMVGYPRMMGADEAGTLTALRHHRETVFDPAVAAHGGRIVKLIGDGTLVEFSSVVDAVKCAVAIQRTVNAETQPAIMLRIGINLGDVIVQGDDIYGDGVNVAARLEPLAEPGGVCVASIVIESIGNRIDVVFKDGGEVTVKNIDRPIRIWKWHPNSDLSASRPTQALPVSVKAQREPPSIAVLPFENMSGDPEQDYFADGIVDDITTGLSRIKWLFVIARNSSFVYKGRAVDVRQVGRELGVRYILEGGVRKAAQRLRITAQLVDSATGAHVWADRFDGALKDVFDLQDRITESVVAAVEPSVRKSEIERSRQKRPDSLDAYDLYLRALPYTAASQSGEEGKIALGFLENALKIDPDYAAAHALIAWCYEWRYSRAGFDQTDKVAALSHARAAIKGGVDDANALAIAGFVIVMLDKDQAGLNAIDRALAINPSCATALFVGSAANAFVGRSSLALSYANRALRLSPFDLLVSVAHVAKGIASVQRGRYAEAATYLDHSVEASPTQSSFRFLAACVHALAGDLDKARSLVKEALTMEPDFRLRIFFELNTRATAEKLAEGGRILGLSD